MRAPSLSLPRRRASALVVVLLLLVLLTVLALAFFAASQIEARSSAAFDQLGTLRRLSAIPLEVVEAQIRAATLAKATNAAGFNTLAWASQPGLIRVFDGDGRLKDAYKLYSSSKMVEGGMGFLSGEIPSGWRGQTEDFVNLNRPVQSQITGVSTYPILNPGATNHATGLAIRADASGTSDAAMPVAWLYVLKSGAIVPRSEITAEDLPVGRIAFWTDDESCKVNLNTAGERVYWERPQYGTALKQRLMYYQPSTGEYNAYPGHPATVSLSAVFGDAALAGNPVQRALALTPRYAWGGSENATLATYPTNGRTSLDRLKAGSTVKNDRLIPTEDEVLFDPTRQALTGVLGNATSDSGFLLTTASRSPELNLWGLPRVGLWPVDTNPDKQTVYDRLIARCLTINGTRGERGYFFQRANPHARNEADAIPGNARILQYLDDLTANPVPGQGGKFQQKYGVTGMRQILTEIFDFIRAGVNLSDTSVIDPVSGKIDFTKQFTPANTQSRGYVLPTQIPGWGTRGFGRLPVLTHVGIVLYAYAQKDLNPPIHDGTDNLETKVHAMLWFNFANPMLGVAPIANRYKIVLKNYQLGIRNADGTAGGTFALRANSEDRFQFPNDRGRDHGGYEGMIGPSQAIQIGSPSEPLKTNYAFHSTTPMTIQGDAMQFIGGPLELEIWDYETNQKLQTYTLDLPSSTAPWPIPLPWHETDKDKTPADPATFVDPLEFWERDPSATNDTGQNPSSSPSIIIGTRRNWNGRQARDVIRSVELRHGDARIIAGLENIPASLFQTSKGYFDGSRRIATSMIISRNWGQFLHFFDGDYGKHAPGRFNDEVNPASNQYGLVNHPPLPAEFERDASPTPSRIPFTSLRDLGWAGDFDAGWLNEPDGPWLNKPDEGFIANDAADLPYAGVENTTGLNLAGNVTIRSWDPRINGFFSPTRQIPSAVQLGSLPTGINLAQPEESRPWQTLVFSPNSQAAMVASGNGFLGHPGATDPPDYLLLDLFTMPVVESYAISEPFSTAGKINLNQRLIPFTHITRETGLHAVLKNLGLPSVEHNSRSPAPDSRYSKTYIKTEPDKGNMPYDFVDTDRTLEEIGKVLDPGGKKGEGAFRSASEICNVFLIPQGLGTNSITNYWKARQFTADNTREAPYKAIYPLLTTQSNTYRIHYLVQALVPLRSKVPFDPKTDFRVSGQLQGSYLIERYLDENDPDLDVTAKSFNDFYRFRILNHKRFTPGQ